jgi:hypothetical protein
MRHPFMLARQWLLASICMVLSLITPALSLAEVSLTFLPMEESKYLIRGQGFEGISAVNLTVDYDTTYLFFPQVDVMGGELLEENRGAATSPGNLELHIRRQDPNAPFEVTIYFQKRGPFDAIINFVTAEVADLSGDFRPVIVEMVKPSPSMNEPDAPVSPTHPAPESDGAPAAPEEEQRKPVAYRFRDFTGGKTFSAFTALFSEIDPSCRQTPPVVVADGTRFAEVVVAGLNKGNRTPRCTVSGGRLVAAQPGARQEWVLVVQPGENEWNVRIHCAAAHRTIEIPLIAAPAIEIPYQTLAGINERTFMPRLRSFIAERAGKGKTESPVWLLEYLFTANYLLAQEESAPNLSFQKDGKQK